jgi:hypothetical protein
MAKKSVPKRSATKRPLKKPIQRKKVVISGNDPWNQVFNDFRNYYRSLSGQIPRVSTFESSSLKTMINFPGAVKIAFYPMPHPNTPGHGIMVAVAFDSSGNRLSTANMQYGFAVHNCPPDCDLPYDQI